MTATYRISRLWDGSLDTASEGDNASDVIIQFTGNLDSQVVEIGSNKWPL